MKIFQQIQTQERGRPKSFESQTAICAVLTQFNFATALFICSWERSLTEPVLH